MEIGKKNNIDMNIVVKNVFEPNKYYADGCLRSPSF
jgi:hypothetical protein